MPDPTPTPCRGADPATFDSRLVIDHLAAIRCCASCPLATRVECLRAGIEARADGTWGGTLLRDGEPVRAGRCELTPRAAR